MNNVVTTLAPLFSSTFFQVTRTIIKSQMGLKFSQIGPHTAELAALEHLENSPYTYNGRNVVTYLVPSVLDGFSPFFQVITTTMKAWRSLNFNKIPSVTTGLAAFEHLKNQ